MRMSAEDKFDSGRLNGRNWKLEQFEQEEFLPLF